MSRSSRESFNYTGAVQSLLEDIVGQVPLFAHVDLAKIGVGFSQAKVNTKHGYLAKLVPLRFENGERVGAFRGRDYTMPVYCHGDAELLYLMCFYLPRFQNLDVRGKLKTTFHELYHIGPSFNGDIRRFPGPKFAHGPSREWYDSQFAPELDAYFAEHFRLAEHPWMKLDWKGLSHQHGAISGTKYPMPKLVAVQGTGRANVLRVRQGKASQADLDVQPFQD